MTSYQFCESNVVGLTFQVIITDRQSQVHVQSKGEDDGCRDL